MALTLVQSKTAGTAGAAASLTATFTSGPTSGNLLIAQANADNTGSMTSSGWTLAVSSINASGLYHYYKIAGASESSAVQWSPSASASTELIIAEYSGNDSVPLDKTASASGAGTSIASGTTAATTQADELALAGFGLSGGGVATPPSAYSNSFVQVAFIAGTGGTTTSDALASKALVATGTQSSTATVTSGNTPSGVIATYKAAAAAASTVYKIPTPRAATFRSVR